MSEHVYIYPSDREMAPITDKEREQVKEELRIVRDQLNNKDFAVLDSRLVYVMLVMLEEAEQRDKDSNPGF